MGKELSKISQMICVKNSFYKVVLFGTQFSGKTSVFQRIKSNEFFFKHPTIGFNIENININNTNLTIYDFGGHEKMKKLWENYLENIDLVILVIDSTDKESFIQLENIYEMLNKFIPHVYILLLINKIDLKESLENEAIFELSNFYKYNLKIANTQRISAYTGENIELINPLIIRTLNSMKFVIKKKN
jgi:small GTP-binding protein